VLFKVSVKIYQKWVIDPTQGVSDIGQRLLWPFQNIDNIIILGAEKFDFA